MPEDRVDESVAAEPAVEIRSKPSGKVADLPADFADWMKSHRLSLRATKEAVKRRRRG